MPMLNSSVAERERRVRGILLMIMAFAFFASLDASAKYLAQAHPTVQIVWVRYAGHFLVALLWFSARHGSKVWRSRSLGLQIVRSLLLFLATLCNFFALRYLQLAETASIFFTVPLIVAALSVPLLGERVGPRRWSAVFVGFAGVLIIVQPGLGVVHWAAGFSLLAAFCTALYLIATRKLAGVDDASTTQFYTAFVGFMMLTPVVPWYWTPPTESTIWVMAGVAVFGAVGHYVLVVAHHLAPAPVLAPFSYTQMVWMTLLGYLIFADIPGPSTVLGSSIVIGSGIYLWCRERTRSAN